IDFEQDCIAPGITLHACDQPLSWLRVRMPLLLRPIYARIHGNGAGRIRKEDLLQAKCGLAAGAGAEASETGGRDRAGNGDRSVSAAGAAAAGDALASGGVCTKKRARAGDCDQVAADCARPGFAQAGRGEKSPDGTRNGDDNGRNVGTYSGAAGASAGPALAGRAEVTRGRRARRGDVLTPDAGDYRQSCVDGRGGAGGGRGKGELLRIRSVVFETMLLADIFRIRGKALSRTG